MSHEERNAHVALLCNLLVNGYVILRLRGMFAGGAFDGPDAPQVWARMILWVIGAAIVLTIALTILFNILFAIVTRDENPSFVKDERDELFGIRAMGMTMFICAGGFVATIVALAMGASALTGFLIIYFAFALGSLAGDMVKLASYRAGG